MFKTAFKYYKNKNADLSAVVNICPDDENLEVFQKNPNHVFQYLKECSFGLLPPNDWDIFQLKNKPGLLLIRNPFTTLGQRYWIVRCLQDFSRKPNKLNIDAHNYIKEHENWWDVCHTDNETNNSLLRKLRWATLGYHYNWDTKVYDESSRSSIPDDLQCVGYTISRLFGYFFVVHAAIVNYYQMNSTLSGHTDHSENDLEAPLMSISFGQSAIFLIGGHTEDCPAVPIFINSGDIIIMSKESRLCYHAIPRILPASTEPWNSYTHTQNIPDPIISNKPYLKDETFWQPFNDYLQSARINMNIRQVLKFPYKINLL